MRQRPDVCIVGAGIIGLALALELNHLGASVCVLERDTPLSQASRAAAGMLAVDDPANPPELRELSRLSVEGYPAFLDRVASLSGQWVPFQTAKTFQSVEPGATGTSLPATPLPAGVEAGARTFIRLEENSLDPRQLAGAVLAAVRNTSIELLDHSPVHAVRCCDGNLQVHFEGGVLHTSQVVHTLGAWSLPPVAPRKGQMLSVRIPAGLTLDYVVRTPEVYIVPRTQGPQAGCAILGATVEDAGFSVQTDPGSLAALRALAASLVPALADEHTGPLMETWAGLRPHTPDHLPLLGELPGLPNQFLATGHYRNGILLAPGTARVMAQLLAGKHPTVSLKAFAPSRFLSPPEDRTEASIFAHQP